MKTIGLLGGMSWESSNEYYRLLNRMVKDRLGGQNSCRCILYSVNFQDICEAEWETIERELVKAAKALEGAGADFLIMCSNTVHKVAPQVQAAIGIPLLEIGDAAAMEIRAQGLDQVGLLGTRTTMEEDFYSGKLAREYGIQVIVPDAEDRQAIQEIIFGELTLGIINPISKQKMKNIIDRLVTQGAKAIILGCTEIPLLVGQEDASVPVIDTLRIHVKAAAELALKDV